MAPFAPFTFWEYLVIIWLALALVTRPGNILANEVKFLGQRSY